MKKTSEERQEKFVKPSEIKHRDDPPTLTDLLLAIPSVIEALDTSIIKRHQERPDWTLYRPEIRDGNPFIVREMCDRCGKERVKPAWMRIRACPTKNLGTVYLETGLCKGCVNASIYRDKYLDGLPLPEKQAVAQTQAYMLEYERAWRMVLAAAPVVAITEAEWQKACKFFCGCAFCGGPIEVRAKLFPRYLNGEHTAWNVIPLCSDCLKTHYRGRVNSKKIVKRFKVFGDDAHFNKLKTTRMYLLQQMRNHGIYMDPLIPYIERFHEMKTLEGSE